MSTNTNITDLSLNNFINVLSGNEPVPGGGGASALVGAIGIALGNMVGALTEGKKRFEYVEPDIQKLIKRSTELQKELLKLVEEDAKVFAPLAKAYGLTASTEEERFEKDRVLAYVLKKAALVPLHIMEITAESIDICEEFARKGNPIAISDAGVGVEFSIAAMKGAALNVFINTKLMKDRKLAREINKKAEALIESSEYKANRIYDTVKKELKV